MYSSIEIQQAREYRNIIINEACFLKIKSINQNKMIKKIKPIKKYINYNK